MAGNIIPAIATTNAIVAGLVVLFALNVLQKKLQNCQCVYVRCKPNHRNQQVVPEKFLNPPNSKCYVCSPKPQVTVCLDASKMLVEELVETVLKKSLNMVAPDAVLASTGAIIISSDEEESEMNNGKKLADVGIVDGSILEVDDFLQDYKLIVNISQREIPRDGPDFVVVANPDDLTPKESVSKNGESSEDKKGADTNVSKEDDDDDDIIMTCEDDLEVATTSTTEKRKAEETCPVPVKKRKTGDQESFNASKDAITIID